MLLFNFSSLQINKILSIVMCMERILIEILKTFDFLNHKSILFCYIIIKYRDIFPYFAYVLFRSMLLFLLFKIKNHHEFQFCLYVNFDIRWRDFSEKKKCKNSRADFHDFLWSSIKFFDFWMNNQYFVIHKYEGHSFWSKWSKKLTNIYWTAWFISFVGLKK